MLVCVKIYEHGTGYNAFYFDADCCLYKKTSAISLDDVEMVKCFLEVVKAATQHNSY